jgi:redox-sensitive bicupin YhaK (pirin superfamily)
MKNSNVTVYRSQERGYAYHGWLETYHSFSFSSYYKPDRVQFGALRVLNDDTIAGGRGFGMHPHNNMEIITIVLSGALEHKDSMGNTGVIYPGEVQAMSAGTGITHSEFNHSQTETVQLLQLWVIPNQAQVTPRYQHIKPHLPLDKLNMVVSPEKSEDRIWIYQNTYFYLGEFTKEQEIHYQHKNQHGVYLFVIEGQVEIEHEKLNSRDAVSVITKDTQELSIKVFPNSKILLIDTI